MVWCTVLADNDDPHGVFPTNDEGFRLLAPEVVSEPEKPRKYNYEPEPTPAVLPEDPSVTEWIPTGFGWVAVAWAAFTCFGCAGIPACSGLAYQDVGAEDSFLRVWILFADAQGISTILLEAWYANDSGPLLTGLVFAIFLFHCNAWVLLGALPAAVGACCDVAKFVRDTCSRRSWGSTAPTKRKLANARRKRLRRDDDEPGAWLFLPFFGAGAVCAADRDDLLRAFHARAIIAGTTAPLHFIFAILIIVQQAVESAFARVTVMGALFAVVAGLPVGCASLIGRNGVEKARLAMEREADADKARSAAWGGPTIGIAI